MLFIYITSILSSFFLTFLLAIPFIKLLYKYNIRRISKADLDSVLPGRTVKLGTPIMGGAVILFSISLLSLFFLFDWKYTPLIIIVCLLGGIIGAVDEYSNTLGRTFKAIRISRSHQGSLFNASGLFLTFKKFILYPWAQFEELLRMMGSQQRGLKSHYKMLMHIGLAILIAVYLEFFGHPQVFHLGFGISVDIFIFYFVILIGYLIFFANAFGITDGMDGLSAGTHAISFVLLGIFAAYSNNYELAVLAFIITGAELAFLYFNIYPARMEMSDVGTVPLGMLLVLIGFLAGIEGALLILGGLYLAEIFSSLIQVWSVKLRNKRVFLIAPLHHHFEKMGWPETKVTMRFWLANAVLGLVALAIALI